MRKTARSLAMALIVACAAGPSTATTLSTEPGSTTTPRATSTTIDPPPATTAATTTTPATTAARDLAPEFSLQLGDGSDFVLSAEQKPVFLVFWAEW